MNMDSIQALKLLLEVDAGTNVTQVAIWYVIGGFFQSLLIAATILTALVLLLRTISRMVRSLDAIKRWRCMLNTGSSGDLSEYELVATVRRIDALIAESKN